MRQIVLDTETTGLEVSQGHRIIEIGCIELVNRRVTGNHWHHYINPGREIDSGAFEVHGISTEFLQDKHRFAELAEEFRDYVAGAELVIHNAPFDVSFMDYEFRQVSGAPLTAEICTVKDSLAVARAKHPGQKNNLDALCRRYQVDNSQRQLHGALLDAEILADVYLLMTGGQTQLFGVAEQHQAVAATEVAAPRRITAALDLVVVRANGEESDAHEAFLDMLEQHNEAPPIWRHG